MKNRQYPLYAVSNYHFKNSILTLRVEYILWYDSAFTRYYMLLYNILPIWTGSNLLPTILNDVILSVKIMIGDYTFLVPGIASLKTKSLNWYYFYLSSFQ